MKIQKTLSTFRRTSLAYGLVFCLVLSLIPSKLAFADANKLYVTPSTSQMNTNTTFTVNIRTYADTDQPTGSTSGTVTYPTSQLQVTGISVSGSGYGSPTISQGSGTIGFSGSRSPAPGGNAQVFAITFKSIGAGTAVVGFTNNSKVNNTTTTYNSGVYTIINPSPPPATPTPSTTPRPSTTPPKTTPVPVASTPEPSASPGGSTPQTTPDPAGVVDSVSASTRYTTANVSWKVNADNPTTTLVYGTSTTQLDKKATVAKQPNGTFAADITGLTPGVRYMFTITADGAGGKSGNYTGSFPTRGYPVTLTVTENKQPVESGQVKIGNQNAYISSSGKVTLGLAAGDYSGTITTDTASLAINLTVKAKDIPTDGKDPETQAFAYNLTSASIGQGPGAGTSILTFVMVLVGGSIVLGLGFAGFMAYRRRKFESGDDVAYSMNNSSSVIIDDGYNWHNEPQANDPSLPPAMPTITHPAPQVPPTQHNNSVYLSEEEPLDMFEEAAKRLPLPPNQNHPSSTDPNETEQNSNSPRSTTP